MGSDDRRRARRAPCNRLARLLPLQRVEVAPQQYSSSLMPQLLQALFVRESGRYRSGREVGVDTHGLTPVALGIRTRSSTGA